MVTESWSGELNYSEALVVHGCRMLCINVYLLFVAHV